MSYSDCPDCRNTPCTCRTEYMGSKIHAYKVIYLEKQTYKAILEEIIDTYNWCDEDPQDRGYRSLSDLIFKATQLVRTNKDEQPST